MQAGKLIPGKDTGIDIKRSDHVQIIFQKGAQGTYFNILPDFIFFCGRANDKILARLQVSGTNFEPGGNTGSIRELYFDTGDRLQTSCNHQIPLLYSLLIISP